MKVLFENGKGDTYEVAEVDAIELAHSLSDTLAKVGIDIKDSDETLKSLGELIKESVKVDKVK